MSFVVYTLIFPQFSLHFICLGWEGGLPEGPLALQRGRSGYRIFKTFVIFFLIGWQSNLCWRFYFWLVSWCFTVVSPFLIGRRNIQLVCRYSTYCIILWFLLSDLSLNDLLLFLQLVSGWSIWYLLSDWLTDVLFTSFFRLVRRWAANFFLLIGQQKNPFC